MKERDAFWEDFRARARLRPRAAPARAAAAAAAWRWPLAATAAAAAALLVAAYVAWPEAPASPEVSVKSLEVVASHSAVLIMEDEPSRGTIVWVVGMDGKVEQEGDT
jgi:hypothetical protein